MDAYMPVGAAAVQHTSEEPSLVSLWASPWGTLHNQPFQLISNPIISIRHHITLVIKARLLFPPKWGIQIWGEWLAKAMHLMQCIRLLQYPTNSNYLREHIVMFNVPWTIHNLREGIKLLMSHIKHSTLYSIHWIIIHIRHSQLGIHT